MFIGFIASKMLKLLIHSIWLSLYFNISIVKIKYIECKYLICLL